MSRLTTLPHLWWLLLVSVVIGSALLLRVHQRPRPPASAAPKPRQISVRPRVPGVVSSPLGSEEHVVALGDFNGDGHPDLATTDQDYNSDEQGAVVLWFGNGKGALRRGPALPGVDAVALATLDAEGDGDADLLTASPLQLWCQDGQGKLVPQLIPMSPDLGEADDVATGDVDGDGDVDIVFSSSARLGMALNEGQGQWHVQEVPQKLAGFNEPYKRVALADVDGDQDLDILSPGKQGNLLLNDGRGRFGHEQRLPSARGVCVAIGDLNGDARPDLVMDVATSDIDVDRLGVYLNDGKGHFGGARLSQTLAVSKAWVALGDVDQDGNLDVVTGYKYGEVEVRLNRGQAQFEPAYLVARQPSDIEELHLADINHDGRLELLCPSVAEPGPLARARQPLRATLTTLPAPTGAECYEEVDQMPTALGGGAVLSAVEAALQAHLGLAAGYRVDPAFPPYQLAFVVGPDGAVEHPRLGGRISPAVDSTMLRVLRRLRLTPGRLHGQAVRVALQLAPRLMVLHPPETFPSLPNPGEDPLYAHVAHPPTLVGGKPLVPFLRTWGVEQHILPDSVRLPAHGRLVEEVIVEKDGSVQSSRTLAGINPVVDAALRPSFDRLPRVVPGRHRGRRVRVALLVSIELTKHTRFMRQAEAERREAQTWRRGWARRHPGETDAQFVHRVLPLSLEESDKLTAYAWRPTAYGKQLFMTRQGQGDNEYGMDLLVLDPYRPHTYVLRVLPVTGLDDRVSLNEFFAADVDHDGHPELLALKQCDLRGTRLERHGRETYTGSEPRYATDVFRLAGTDCAGRPRYQLETTYRPYLDDLPTGAAVRRAVRKHWTAGRKTHR